MPPIIDHVGQVFAELTVLSRAIMPSDYVGEAKWTCSCSCGVIAVVPGYRLRTGQTKSCGHLQSAEYRRTHGHADGRGAGQTKEYKAWVGMRERCKPAYKEHANYFDRGIHVWPEWDRRGGFEGFLDHVGIAPSKKHSLDRIDNNRGYEPGNVQWATWDVQHANRRKVGSQETEIRRLRGLLEDAGLGHLV